MTYEFIVCNDEMTGRYREGAMMTVQSSHRKNLQQAKENANNSQKRQSESDEEEAADERSFVLA